MINEKDIHELPNDWETLRYMMEDAEKRIGSHISVRSKEELFKDFSYVEQQVERIRAIEKRMVMVSK